MSREMFCQNVRSNVRSNVSSSVPHCRYSATKRVPISELANGVPLDRWIGMKFVVITLPNGDVRLELFCDLSSGTDGGR